MLNPISTAQSVNFTGKLRIGEDGPIIDTKELLEPKSPKGEEPCLKLGKPNKQEDNFVPLYLVLPGGNKFFLGDKQTIAHASEVIKTARADDSNKIHTINFYG